MITALPNAAEAPDNPLAGAAPAESHQGAAFAKALSAQRSALQTKPGPGALHARSPVPSHADRAAQPHDKAIASDADSDAQRADPAPPTMQATATEPAPAHQPADAIQTQADNAALLPPSPDGGLPLDLTAALNQWIRAAADGDPSAAGRGEETEASADPVPLAQHGHGAKRGAGIASSARGQTSARGAGAPLIEAASAGPTPAAASFSAAGPNAAGAVAIQAGKAIADAASSINAPRLELATPAPGSAFAHTAAASTFEPPVLQQAPAMAERSVAADVHSPQFAPALGATISLMLREGVQQARLALQPAELGPITVQIALDGQSARIDFQAEVAATRSAIEAALPSLAGALREGGLTLSGGGVFHQGSGPGGGAGDPRSFEHGPGARALDDAGAQAQAAPAPLPRARGVVDLYA